MPKTNGKDTIVVALTLGSELGKGVVTSTSHALARPFNQLFEEGEPIGKINYVFFMIKRNRRIVLGRTLIA